MAESPKERLDRETIELLNELRVILPGVQVLLAFLLTAPFNQRFNAITATERAAYFLALLCTAAATALLIAPSALHRILWRGREKEFVLRLSNLFTIAGLVLVATGIVSAVGLVTSVLYGQGLTVAVTVGAALLFGVLWFALPLLRRASGGDDAGGPGEESAEPTGAR
jgi:hypothetical protein